MADPNKTQTTALVLFSGGQDSTVCLAWALENFDHVETLGFDYDQRHKIELQVRPKVITQLSNAFPNWSRKLGPDHLLELTELGQLSDTALTRTRAIEISANGLPTTFVPGRNLIFLTYAAALAYRRGIKTLVGGMCETDYSGYPDCRRDTIEAMARAISLGIDDTFNIETPLMFIDKRRTWQLAHDIGGQELVKIIIEDTHTCYLGMRDKRHPWGYGCGTCPACQLREKGWNEWQTRLEPVKN